MIRRFNRIAVWMSLGAAVLWILHGNALGFMGMVVLAALNYEASR